ADPGVPSTPSSASPDPTAPTATPPVPPAPTTPPSASTTPTPPPTPPAPAAPTPPPAAPPPASPASVTPPPPAPASFSVSGALSGDEPTAEMSVNAINASGIPSLTGCATPKNFSFVRNPDGTSLYQTVCDLQKSTTITVSLAGAGADHTVQIDVDTPRVILAQ